MSLDMAKAEIPEKVNRTFKVEDLKGSNFLNCLGI